MISLSAPLSSMIMTSGWGDPRSDHKHQGVDLRAAPGTNVYAAADGKVIRDAYDDTSGNYVGIDHGGIRTDYMHLSQKFVKNGDTVKRGQLIAASGNTGIKNSAPHLHFQVLVTEKLLPEWISKFGSTIGSARSGWYPVPAEPVTKVDEYLNKVDQKASEKGIPLYSWTTVLAGGGMLVAAVGTSILVWLLLRRK